MNNKQVFRPTFLAWLRYDLMPLICYIIMGIVAFFAPAVIELSDLWLDILGMVFGGMFMLTLFGIYFAITAIFMVVNIDEERIEFKRGWKTVVEITWPDVSAVWIGVNDKKRPTLFMQTQQEILPVLIQYFNVEKFWSAIQSYAPSDVRLEKPEENLNDSVVQAVKINNELSNIVFDRPLRVTTNWRNTKVIEMDQEMIRYTIRSKKYGMKWAEIETVQIPTPEENIIFYAPHKRLVIPGRGFWKGDDFEKCVEWLDFCISEYDLEVSHNSEFWWKFPRGVKL